MIKYMYKHLHYHIPTRSWTNRNELVGDAEREREREIFHIGKCVIKLLEPTSRRRDSISAHEWVMFDGRCWSIYKHARNTKCTAAVNRKQMDCDIISVSFPAFLCYIDFIRSCMGASGCHGTKTSLVRQSSTKFMLNYHSIHVICCTNIINGLSFTSPIQQQSDHFRIWLHQITN